MNFIIWEKVSRNSYYTGGYSRTTDLTYLEESTKKALRKIYAIIKGKKITVRDYPQIDSDLLKWSTNRYFHSKIKENHITIQFNYSKIARVRIALISSEAAPTGKEMATLVYHLGKLDSIQSLHLIISEKFFSSDSDNPTVLRFRLPNLKKIKIDVIETNNPNYHHELRFEERNYPYLEYFNSSNFPRNFRNLSSSFFSKFPNLTTVSLGMDDPMHMIDSYSFLVELIRLLGDIPSFKHLILHDYYHNLPDNISSLESLVGLSIVNNPKREMYSLPQNMDKLANLEIFDLWRYDIGEFPVNLLNISNMKIFQIVHSSISSIPIEIGKWENLQEFVVVNAELTEVPKELATIKTIRFLDFENNMIENLSPLFFDKRIKLNLKNNPHQSLETKIHGFERIAGSKIQANMDFHPEDSKEYKKYDSAKAFRRKHRQLLDAF